MPVSHVIVLCLFACLFAGAASAAGPLLKADFEKSPKRSGWRTGADRGDFQGAWAEAEEGSSGRFLLAEKGHWQSPPVAVAPLDYYRLRFRAKAQTEGYWAAEFFDADGNQLQADHYDSLPGSRDWRAHEYCFRANIDAATVRVRFIARRSSLAVDDVTVEKITPRAAADWADAVYASVPPIHYAPPPSRWKLLPKTIQKLRRGPSIRIVLLGDSIANDTANSAFDVLLQRAYPKCRVELVNSVRSGTGCGWYRQNDRIAQYVLAFKPDLLIIAGISNGYDHQAVGDVIRQVRAESDCEIMVMTGCIHPRVQGEIYFAENSPMPREEACEVILKFPGRIRALAGSQKVELLDIRAAWDEYVGGSPMPHAWYMRDPIHANARGKQVIGRILLS
ncbi:MAG: SGNH/GDSL hydrolase family protein, partial [Phycisphaerae bacterium]